MHLKFSQDLEVLLKRLIDRPLTLKDILHETSERGFSLVIGLLVLPFLFPMPPGLTTILGSGILLLAAQMVIGRREPWLPRKVANFQFPLSVTRQLLQNLRRVTKGMEKVVRPRWLNIAVSRKTWRINGICLAWLALLLMLPIPFTNPLPTLVILLLAVATLEEDGLLMCVSYGLTTLLTLFFALIVYSFWQVPDLIQRLFN